MISQPLYPVCGKCGQRIWRFPHYCIGVAPAPPAPVAYGCICPVGAEKTCRGIGCPRRNPFEALPGGCTCNEGHAPSKKTDASWEERLIALEKRVAELEGQQP